MKGVCDTGIMCCLYFATFFIVICILLNIINSTEFRDPPFYLTSDIPNGIMNVLEFIYNSDEQAKFGENNGGGCHGKQNAYYGMREGTVLCKGL